MIPTPNNFRITKLQYTKVTSVLQVTLEWDSYTDEQQLHYQVVGFKLNRSNTEGTHGTVIVDTDTLLSTIKKYVDSVITDGEFKFYELRGVETTGFGECYYGRGEYGSPSS